MIFYAGSLHNCCDTLVIHLFITQPIKKRICVEQQASAFRLMSLLDHFGEGSSEPVLLTPSAGFENGDTVTPFETGYLSTGLAEDNQTRIFSLDRVQFEFKSNLICLAVSNNFLVMALETNHILRIDLQQAHEVEEIEISRKPNEGKIYKFFFDPTGRHLLITFENGDNYYLYEKWKKPRILSKFKGIVIESVAWNRHRMNVNDSSTKEILIGTRNGQIWETCLEPAESTSATDLFRRDERYLKQVYSLSTDRERGHNPITGLHFEQFPGSPKKYFVVATTPTRIYQFIGTVGSGQNSGGIGAVDREGGQAIFEGLFARYEVNPGFQELPGDLGYSELHFFSEFQDQEHQGAAQTFAWLTGPGIYHGNLMFGSQNVGDSVIDSALLLPYPTATSDAEQTPVPPEVPLSIALTEFHFILLYRDRVRAICQLNDEIVYEETIPLSRGQKVKALTIDILKHTFWIYTNTSIYELLISREDRDVWKLYMEKKQYDTALQYAKDPVQRDKVVTTQANDYFNQGRYLLSANYFAQSVSIPFEEVALRFVERDERDALRMYLVNKLEKLKKGDLTQKNIIATWLVEIYLSKINLLDDLSYSSHAASDVATGEAPPGLEGIETNNYETEKALLVEEFHNFLETYAENLDKRTTYNLIASHGRMNELLHFAQTIGDSDRVISHWCQEKQWDKALEALSKQTSSDAYYKFSPVLMENAPYETVNLWVRQSNLNPRNLIPALLRYDHSRLPENVPQNQAIRYLNYVVKQLHNTDPAIHNFLLTLYATQPSKDEVPLLEFLKKEGKDMHYNLDYALRVCSQNGRMQSCVHIYSQMGLFEEAVNLALKHHDLELAGFNADKPEDDDGLRKKLWLNIARHVVEQKKDIKKAMEFLRQSGDILKIEDILPFFPDFVLIDDFKDEICKALEEYNIHIEHLKSEMDEATRSAENIRLDIRELRSRFAIIQAIERCNICDLPLLSRQFYVFPCQHAFHAECLINTVTKNLKSAQVRRMVDLQEQLTKEMTVPRAPPPPAGFGATNAAAAAANRLATAAGNLRGVIFPADHTAAGGDDVTVVVAKSEQLKEELDDIVASECILCGDLMIKTVDQPFLVEEELEATVSWAV